MPATSPQRMDGEARVAVTSREFERRLAAHGHPPDEIHRLWNELASAEPTQASPAPTLLRGLGALVSAYLGLALVVAASVSVVAVFWDDLGAGGVLAVAAAYLGGYLGASELLRRRSLTLPAAIVEAVALAWVALATYAVEDLVGIWPVDASTIDHVHVGMSTIAVVGLTTALVLLRLRPAPLLSVPIGIALALLAVDAAELVFGNQLGDRERVTFILPLGLTWIAVGLMLDGRGARSSATWAYWVGLALTSITVMILVPKTVPGFALVGILGALALFFSTFVRHLSFTIVGALGVLIALLSSITLLGRLAPFVIAVVGIGLIYVGVRWSRWRERFRVSLLARMPPRLRGLVTRLSH